MPNPFDQFDATPRSGRRANPFDHFDGDQSAAQGEPSVLGDVVGQFGESFNRGLYGFANLPTSLANLGMDAVGADYRFKRPLEAAAPSVDRTIMEVPEAQTSAGEWAGTVGEVAGANAIPGAGLLGAAPRIAAATAGSRNLAGQSVNRAAQGVANTPGRAAAGEALATVGAGTGMQIARDVAPGSDTAEVIGGTAGGLLAPMAAVTPSALAMRGANAARSRLSPESVERSSREAVQRGLRENMTPETEQAIRETAGIQEAVPGYRPSVAEATESPDFIATQTAFERGMSGPELNQAISRYRQNEQAVSRATGDQAPSSPSTLDDTFAQARRRPQRVTGRLTQADEAQQRAAAMAAEGLESGQRRRDIGAGIRDDLIAERARTKEEMRISAEEMGLNDPAARFDFGSAKGRLKTSVQPRSRLADRSAIPSRIIDDVENMDDRASIVDLMELRSRITTDIREAQRTPTGEKRVPYLEKLKSEVDNTTDDLIRATDDPELAGRLREFRDMYRRDYVAPFEQGAAGRILQKDVTGAYKVPDEQVAKEFFDGWNQTSADQFQRTFQNAPGANAAMEAAAMDDLHAFAVRDGVLDPNRIAAWARKHQGVIGSFPNVQRRLQTTENAVQDIARRRSTIADRKKQVEQAYLSRELARLDSPISGTTPERIVEQAIDRNPARMNRLMNAVKSDEGRNAIARHVWDSALSSGDPVAFINRNGPSISKALGPKMNEALKLARAIEKNKLVPRPAGQPMETNPVAGVENTLGTGLNQISSRIFAVQSGRTGARYALADIAGRAFRTMTANQARDTLREAIYDPQVATELANALTHRNVKPQTAKRLYTFLVSNGIVAGQEGPLELTVTGDEHRQQ